jgi:superkiller protein 3
VYQSQYYNLGTALHQHKQLPEAIAAYHKAIALEPKFAPAYYNLGIALYDQKQLPEAIAAYHKAIALEPKFAPAYYNLGNALRQQKQLVEAIAAYDKAIALEPKYAKAYYGLGVALYDQKQLPEAIAAYDKAIALDPKDAKAYYNLGVALHDQKQLPEAIAAFRKSSALDPKDATAYYGLGVALYDQKQLPEAIAAYHKAIALEPSYAEAHCNLGHCLRDQGRFAEAVQSLKKGHELGSARSGWPYPSGRWVKAAERLVELDARLSKVSHGEARPRDANEAVALADLCARFKKRYAVAVRLYTDAFAADPKFAEVLNSHRYNAACAAAQAGCRRGEDAGKLDNQEQVRLRRQALDWLRADLAGWQKRLQKEPAQARAVVVQQMHHWQEDGDFAGVRGTALGRIPATERHAWQQLWDDVAVLLAQAEGKTGAEKK